MSSYSRDPEGEEDEESRKGSDSDSDSSVIVVVVEAGWSDEARGGGGGSSFSSGESPSPPPPPPTSFLGLAEGDLLPSRTRSVYPLMSSVMGKVKCVFTFSFVIVSILNVYLVVVEEKKNGWCLGRSLEEGYFLPFVRGVRMDRQTYD